MLIHTNITGAISSEGGRASLSSAKVAPAGRAPALIHADTVVNADGANSVEESIMFEHIAVDTFTIRFFITSTVKGIRRFEISDFRKHTRYLLPFFVYCCCYTNALKKMHAKYISNLLHTIA